MAGSSTAPKPLRTTILPTPVLGVPRPSEGERLPNVSMIINQIDEGWLAMPTFQRGYVWNSDQVRALMQSLYRRHPVGTLLIWKTSADSTGLKGNPSPPAPLVSLLLDGQQRVTTLYGVIRGKPPSFFEGNEQVFRNLRFNVETEAFQFYTPVQMRDDNRWIDVTDLMQRGPGAFAQLAQDLSSGDGETLSRYFNNLNQVYQINHIEFHSEEISGEEDTDVVVDIFNRINSGGTKLSKGDLALARICARWPEAREEMKALLLKWRAAGFKFTLNWLLRNVNAIVTGKAPFSALADIDTATFANGLKRAEKAIDALLNLIASRLGLDHDAVLGGPAAFPVMARYIDQRGLKLTDPAEQDKLLYWYVHSFLWGRYAGSTETVLAQDLTLIAQPDGALDRLIDQLRVARGGDLTLSARDFATWSRGSRFYPFLYLLTRVTGSKDWGSGIELSKNLLGKLAALDVHHVFPKAQLYKAGYMRPEVNAIANFTFLTKETNLQISDRLPADYIPEYRAKQAGAVESHWMPDDARLLEIDRYPEFLQARRELLAQAANAFLQSLLLGDRPASPTGQSIFNSAEPMLIASDEEGQAVEEANARVVALGFVEGAINHELVSPTSGAQEAVLDLSWPEGLQPGLSEPVALMLDEPPEAIDAASRHGYQSFMSVDALIDHAERLLSGEVAEPPDA